MHFHLQVKQDAVVLYEKLQDLEEKRAEIINENQKRGTPKEERERLLLQVNFINSINIDDKGVQIFVVFI